MHSKLSQEEMTLIEQQIPELIKKINAAKMFLVMQRPFYGRLLAAMPLKIDYKWCSTMATDGFNLYVNPEFVLGFSPEREKIIRNRLNDSLTSNQIDQESYNKAIEQIEKFYYTKGMREISFCLEHESRHIVSNHLERGKVFPDANLYNQAADYYINTTLIQEHIKDKKPWFNSFTIPENKGSEWLFLNYLFIDQKYLGWITEHIYKDLENKRKKSANSSDNKDTSQDKAPDDHYESQGNSSLQDAMGIDKTQRVKISDQEKEEFNIKTESILRSISQTVEESPEDVRQYFHDLHDHKINYKTFLKRTLKSLFKKNLSYKKLSKKCFSVTKVSRDKGYIKQTQRLVMPTYTNDDIIDIVIGFDVSGSLDDEDLKNIYSEIVGITKQYQNFRITMFCWSTKVGNVVTFTHQNIKEMYDYKVTTTYGTKVSCVFDYLDENIKKINQLVIFTDGYFENIAHRKDWAKKYVNTLWIINNNSNFKKPFGVSVDYDRYIK